MEKVAVIGNAPRREIENRYSGRAELCFNPEYENEKSKNEYSAVFLTDGAEQEEAEKWIGNEHLRCAQSDKELFAEMDFFFGIPKRYEIERKFLISRPEESLLASFPVCDFVEISQAYINKNGERFRVRKRGKNGEHIYIKTQKIKISDIKRTELESRISKEEYENAVKCERVLSKRRYLILYKNKCFELDVFPFWQDIALLEIELKSENEQFEIPQGIEVIREVTEEKEYRNSVIAQKYGVPADE